MGGPTLKRETIFVSSGDNAACAAQFMDHLKSLGIAADGPHALDFKAPVQEALGGPLIEKSFSQVSVRYQCDDEQLKLLIALSTDIESAFKAKPAAHVDTDPAPQAAEHEPHRRRHR